MLFAPGYFVRSGDCKISFCFPRGRKFGMFWFIKSDLPFSFACGGVRNLFFSSIMIPGCQPKAQRQRQHCPLCVHGVYKRVCMCVCVPACGEQGQVLPLGPCWGTQVTSPCALESTSVCPVDVSVPLLCGCLWLLASLDGDALSLLCISFSYICESWPQ